ncbi:MAG: cupin domain-containing protein [Hyphomicrobiales bacterium]
MIDPTNGETLVGGVGLTHLRVYEERPAPDGHMSGCAHVHGLTDEGYLVLEGTGSLELHDVDMGFRSIPLARGKYVQFTRGTIHRTVSSGALEILVVIGNSGLAERGDARIYFGRAVDECSTEYDRLNALAADRSLKGALARRDASVAAYSVLVALWEKDRSAYFTEVERFVSVHRRALTESGTGLEYIVGDEVLASGDVPAKSFTSDLKKSGLVYGMCGILHQIQGLEAV